MFGTVYFVCLLATVMNFHLVDSALSPSSCATVEEVFNKRVGPADNVPLSPIPGDDLTVCASTLKYTEGASCCTETMEKAFLGATTDYLHEHIRMSNTKLKSRIEQSLSMFQEHMLLSVQEAHNRTSDILSSLYKIPKEVHKQGLDTLFEKLKEYLTGSKTYQFPDIIEDFFAQLFPAVFEYVLSDPSKSKHTGENFDKCLKEHQEEIQPFGNIPQHLGRKMKYGFQRARIFTETLKVMVDAIESTNNVEVDKKCEKALVRLQFCSMCSGEMEARPCKGFCLNVMRGCLPQLAEISSSWDDLVMAFENLQLGMFKQNNAQELLSYLDGNITEALLQAMDDGPRIYEDVMKSCSEHSHLGKGEADGFKKFSTAEGLQTYHPSTRIHSIRKDITGLISQLEDTKGFLQRLADDLCRVPVIYDQDMQSAQCWNGSAIGRYMKPVPEASIISQVQHNTEVRVSLLPVMGLLQIKDKLFHMRKNLSALFNEELMLSDQPYNSMVGSGAGYSSKSRDVVIDDEDLYDGDVSGSGSGDGPDQEGVDRGDTETETGHTSNENNRRPDNTGVISPGHGKDKPGVMNRPQSGHKKPNNSVGSVTASCVLLVVCAVLGYTYSDL